MSAAERGPARPDPVGRGIVTLPDPLWGAPAVGGLLSAVGSLGLVAAQPWLFPSLGPTALLQAERPGHAGSRWSNPVVGRLVGFAAGALAVLLLGAADGPSVMSDKELAPIRVGAAALSGVLTVAGLALLKAEHARAAATMLLVALGGFKPTWRDAATVAVGVVLIATLGEGGPLPPTVGRDRPGHLTVRSPAAIRVTTTSPIALRVAW